MNRRTKTTTRTGSKRIQRAPAAEVRHVEHLLRRGRRYPPHELAARIAFHRRALADAHRRRTRRTRLHRLLQLRHVRPFK